MPSLVGSEMCIRDRVITNVIYWNKLKTLWLTSLMGYEMYTSKNGDLGTVEGGYGGCSSGRWRSTTGGVDGGGGRRQSVVAGGRTLPKTGPKQRRGKQSSPRGSGVDAGGLGGNGGVPVTRLGGDRMAGCRWWCGAARGGRSKRGGGPSRARSRRQGKAGEKFWVYLIFFICFPFFSFPCS